MGNFYSRAEQYEKMPARIRDRQAGELYDVIKEIAQWAQ